MNDLVVRLHRALLDAMRQRAALLDQPVTVAEIYQDLIPYRLVRSLGFALNADYEFALLQLLAGEDKLARIEPPEVREELRLELLSPNPNVGMFRQYAACDVFVVAAEGAEAAAPASAAEHKRSDGAAPRPIVPNDWLLKTEKERGEKAAAEPKAAAASAPTAQPAKSTSATQAKTPPAAKRSEAAATPATAQDTKAAAAPPPAARPEPSVSPPQKPESPVEQRDAAACNACGRSLPSGRNVRFCPHCGAEQKERCQSCGTDLDRTWQFCVNCGTRVK
jgi:predicted RNA-binding Zn-ribbon protein involved in translation (DUF1610 family)